MESKRVLIKYFLFFFLILFFIFNFDFVSFLFYPEILLKTGKYVFERETQKIEVQDKKEEICENCTQKENSLEIPALEIEAPILVVGEEEEIKASLDKGLVLHPSSVLPGAPGKTIILGHSAMHRWPKSISIWVFTYLQDLNGGEEIFLNFNHKRYTYLVKRKYVLKEGEDLFPTPKEKNYLILITCWPPGRLSYKQRLIVEAEPK